MVIPTPLVFGNVPFGLEPPEPAALDQAPRRSGRIRVPTQKVRDMLPESSGSGLEIVEEPDMVPDVPTTTSQRQRVRLLITEKFRTVANRFGLSRLYHARPSTIPDAVLDLSCCLPRSIPRSGRVQRSVEDIIHPLPNMSAWRLYDHFWRYPLQSRTSRTALQSIMRRPDFSPTDAAAVNFDKIDATLTARQPWTNTAEGWRQASVTVGVPLGHRPNDASRRSDYTARQRIRRHEPFEEIPAERPVAGNHFTVTGFFYRPLVPLITMVFSKLSISRTFHYHPFHLTYLSPDAPSGTLPEGVHGELYTSQAWLDADRDLQNSPQVDGCNLPRAIAAIMFYSDSTSLAQFGTAKAWPIYVFFGNQSKYDRSCPSTSAGYHVAYLPTVRSLSLPNCALHLTLQCTASR